MGLRRKKKIEDIETEVPEEMIDFPDNSEKIDELNNKIAQLERQITSMKMEEPEEINETEEEPDEEEDEEEVEVPPIVPKKKIVKKIEPRITGETKIIQVPVYLSNSEMLRRIDHGIQILLSRGENDKVKVPD